MWIKQIETTCIRCGVAQVMVVRPGLWHKIRVLRIARRLMRQAPEKWKRDGAILRHPAVCDACLMGEALWEAVMGQLKVEQPPKAEPKPFVAKMPKTWS